MAAICCHISHHPPPAAPSSGLSQHPLVALSPKLLPPLEMADDGQKRQIEGALYAVCTTLIIAPR